MLKRLIYQKKKCYIQINLISLFSSVKENSIFSIMWVRGSVKKETKQFEFSIGNSNVAIN
jgi:hypothetical protein